MKLDSIIKTFTKTLDKLDKFVDANIQKQAMIEVNISKLETESAGIGEDIRKAESVRDNIRKILGE